MSIFQPNRINCPTTQNGPLPRESGNTHGPTAPQARGRSARLVVCIVLCGLTLGFLETSGVGGGMLDDRPALDVANSADLSATATARIKSSRCGMIIGLTSVTMSGSSHTDSYRSEDGPYNSAAPGENGHVCSNGDITMSGSTAIVGDGHPGPDHEVKSSSSVGVSGSTDPLTTPMSYPPADPGDASWSNDNLSIPTSDFGKQPLNSKSEFTLSGGDGVDLAPGTYYFSKMSLSGGSLIRISGPTVIYVTGDCSLSGGSLANLTFLPKNLQLYPMGSKCVISGDSEFYGCVYGPTAKVERSGDSDDYGSIVGGELVLSGSGGIHADESLDSIASDGGPKKTKLVQ